MLKSYLKSGIPIATYFSMLLYFIFVLLFFLEVMFILVKQKQTTFEQPASSVSKQSPPLSVPKWIDRKSACKTPSSRALEDYMSW